MGLKEELIRGIYGYGLANPFPIQKNGNSSYHSWQRYYCASNFFIK
jgi:hypothetical protein